MNPNNISIKYILPIDAFIRSIGINIKSPLAFLLGSGASISSGILSAEMCILQWKKSIFLTNNPNLEEQLFDLSLPSVRNRIQTWIENNISSPALGNPNEYGFYAGAAYPISDDRRKFFQNLSTGKIPHVGYQYLALLAREELVNSIWTTNFDGLAAKALAKININPIEIGLDTSCRVFHQPNKGDVRCVSLHGDYRYDELKNTSQEIQEQNSNLIQEFITTSKDTSLIVIGYSGRDASIMDALLHGFTQKGSGRLYWCGYEADAPNIQVKNLIEEIRDNNREAFYISTQGFDDTLERLSFHILSDKNIETAKTIRESATDKLHKESPAFVINDAQVNTIIKSNAFEIDCPSELIQFEASGFQEKGAWKKLKEITYDKQIVAGLLKGKILALGTIDQIKDAFQCSIESDLSRVPITEKELSFENGVINSLLTSALVKSFALTLNLNCDDHELIWKKELMLNQLIEGKEIYAFDAALISLRSIRNIIYLIIKPTIVGKTREGEDIPIEVDRELKRRILTKQYNSEFNNALERWRTLLFTNSKTTFEFPPNCGSTFKFIIRKTPIFAKIKEDETTKSISIPPNFSQHLKQSGIQFKEPKLKFSNRNGDGFTTDTHQLRGIVNNLPYDYSLTKSGLQNEINIGVICPSKDKQKLATFLFNLHQPIPVDSKQEYLLDYPGFSQAFGIPLNLPNPDSNSWVNCKEPDPNNNAKEGASILRKEITRSIEIIMCSSSPNVLIIFIPKRWIRWERYYTDTEKFDLHDFIKAYCVQKGISTQFIREQTLEKSTKCEIVWWLSQSFYTKAMRTPWVLEGLDNDTAFAGLGFSLDYSLGKGNHVILGCSHIYGSNGQGLRYKLSKIENPIIRQKNPFMSQDDARRVGEGIRQLFFESLQKLPSRVVLHKRTPFSSEEKSGLLEGLEGVENIDLLEINIDPMLRYVASRVRNGKFEGDGFPVRRGTALVVENNKALVWVHGTAEAIQPGWKYFQGKSRIPSPL
ncbi:MAG: hypothetical protein GYA51_01075, partial [Candidatus Methanofastidiosa archaeon]|nr:hypothetical protein [Candidatus Methanofastidiosa archaeon]